MNDAEFEEILISHVVNPQYICGDDFIDFSTIEKLHTTNNGRTTVQT